MLQRRGPLFRGRVSQRSPCSSDKTSSFRDCEREPICKSSLKILYRWTRDAPSMALPDGVGVPIGRSQSVGYMVLQVHYGKAFGGKGRGYSKSRLPLRAIDLLGPKDLMVAIVYGPYSRERIRLFRDSIPNCYTRTQIPGRCLSNGARRRHDSSEHA